MEEKSKEINRRDFFKCCAKVALPILGGLLLNKSEAIARVVDNSACNNSCTYSCKASCLATCAGMCMSACAGTCSHSCTRTCSNTCKTSTKSDPVKSDTICQKKH